MQFKIAEVIIVPKHGKWPNEKSSYQPICLLPITSKLFEKLLFKYLRPIIEDYVTYSNPPISILHSTIEQVHHVTDAIKQPLEEKKICTTIFLDMAQVFDKV